MTITSCCFRIPHVFADIDRDLLVPETPLSDPAVAVGQGYSESKWVAEQILYSAEESMNLKPVVVRVGQIAGGINGAWNTSDWVPSIVKSSVALKCLPLMKGVCSTSVFEVRTLTSLVVVLLDKSTSGCEISGGNAT